MAVMNETEEKLLKDDGEDVGGPKRRSLYKEPETLESLSRFYLPMFREVIEEEEGPSLFRILLIMIQEAYRKGLMGNVSPDEATDRWDRELALHFSASEMEVVRALSRDIEPDGEAHFSMLPLLSERFPSIEWEEDLEVKVTCGRHPDFTVGFSECRMPVFMDLEIVVQTAHGGISLRDVTSYTTYTRGLRELLKKARLITTKHEVL